LAGLRRFPATVGECALGHAGDAGGKDVALVSGFELGQKPATSGNPDSFSAGSWWSRAMS